MPQTVKIYLKVDEVVFLRDDSVVKDLFLRPDLNPFCYSTSSSPTFLVNRIMMIRSRNFLGRL
ncbi:hypothetical protein DPMN_154222 [Dreissena polymorpha]|uniref:Uncharacterized protein n=1 Tax=Dreissena polymorpha TaxID=45954 RepID=A0A9D4FKK9_DREPO|nr:hypothetical protein DPMN_154222 [Dreissena polymorpha]